MTEPSTAPTAPSHSSNTSQLPVPPPPPSTATTAPSNSSNTKNTGRKNTNDPPHPNQPLGYRDCASIGPAASEEMFAPVPGDRNNFPVQLHLLLSILEAEGLAYIVSWKPHGRCFAMHQLTAMEQIVLPRFFRQSKYASFQRQLNIYGFQRLSAGPDKGDYYHEMFLRGKLFLANRIQRMSIKGQGPRQPCTHIMEPSFYCMTPLPAETVIAAVAATSKEQQQQDASKSTALLNVSSNPQQQQQYENLTNLLGSGGGDGGGASIDYHSMDRSQLQQLQLQYQQQQELLSNGFGLSALYPTGVSQQYPSLLTMSGLVQQQQQQQLFLQQLQQQQQQQHQLPYSFPSSDYNATLMGYNNALRQIHSGAATNNPMGGEGPSVPSNWSTPAGDSSPPSQLPLVAEQQPPPAASSAVAASWMGDGAPIDLLAQTGGTSSSNPTVQNNIANQSSSVNELIQSLLLQQQQGHAP